MNSILIADAGATKTDWSLIIKDQDDSASNMQKNGNTSILKLQTKGIHPVLNSIEEIKKELGTIKTEWGKYPIKTIHFFGAGCLGERKTLVKELLKEDWPNSSITVESDIVAAAKALFGDGSGIVCILGTGSNTCLWENGKITKQVPSLGYILGDEGSGAALGKRLIHNIYKRLLPKRILSIFHKEYCLSLEDIIERVYRGESPSSFLASFSPFILKHIRTPQIYKLVISEFQSLYWNNIVQYGSNYPIGFSGSISWNYQKYINEVLSANNLQSIKYLKSPILALEKYYSKN